MFALEARQWLVLPGSPCSPPALAIDGWGLCRLQQQRQFEGWLVVSEAGEWRQQNTRGLGEPETLGRSWGLPHFAWAFLNLHALAPQVGCLPWAWSSQSNSSLVVLAAGGRRTVLPALPCESAHHALLCCLVGTLPLAIFLRVSSLPKMILLSGLTTSYILVLELSGYTKVG